MRVRFTGHGWDDYLSWYGQDPKWHGRIHDVIENIRRTPVQGIGKPEALNGDLSGFWARRITGDHRLVYAVKGKDEQQCCHRNHVPVSLLTPALRRRASNARAVRHVTSDRTITLAVGVTGTPGVRISRVCRLASASEQGGTYPPVGEGCDG